MTPLQVTNLLKTFSTGSWLLGKRSQVTVVDTISFEVHQSEIVGLLGPNGAGKTTTIHMLLGVLAPTAGSIVYFGSNFLTVGARSLKRVTYASGYDKLHPNLTVWENLDTIGRLYNLSSADRASRIAYLLEFFSMSSFRDKRGGSLSAGQMTRVMLAKAFLPYPQLVLLDEPTASLDPEVAQEVRAFILEQQKKEGIAVLFTSHNMAEVTELCDRVLMMKNGSIIADDTPTNLAASIKKAHLHLVIGEDIERAVSYAQHNGLSFVKELHGIELEIEEDRITQVLIDLARQGITYTTISIDKPTLEDYFLSVTKERRASNGF